LLFFYKVLISTSTSPYLNEYNLTTSSIVKTKSLDDPFNGQVNAVLQINSNQVVAGRQDSTYKMWNIADYSIIDMFGTCGYGAVTSFAILPGGLLAIGSLDHNVRVLNTQNNKLVVSLSTFDAVQSIMFNPDIGPNGAMVVSITNALVFFDAVTFGIWYSVNTSQTYASMDIHSSTGNVILGANSLDIYNTTASLIYSSAFGSGVNRLKTLPDKATLVIGFLNGNLQLFNLNTQSLASSALSAHSGAVSMLALTPDQVYLITGGADQKLIVWNWATMLLSLINSFTADAPILTGAIMAPAFVGRKNIKFWTIFIHV
jgi:WD40 repeat protein